MFDLLEPLWHLLLSILYTKIENCNPFSFLLFQTYTSNMFDKANFKQSQACV